MPFRANLLEQMLFFNSNLGPQPIVDLWSALALPVVQTAIEIGLFRCLQQQPATVEEIATRLKIDARGASMLLPVLESLGYVRLREGRYAVTAVTEKWLLDGGAINFSAGFAFWGAVIPRLWQNLAESLHTGEPPVNLYAWIENEAEISQHFQAWMVAIATYGLPEVVKRVKLKTNAQRLLDLGGGHGLYAIGFCEKHTNLKATLFDSPRALVSGQANIDAKALATRITPQTGNFMQDPIPQGHDVILLFNIIHGLHMEQNVELVQRCVAALPSGGQLLLMEQLAGGGIGPLSMGLNRLLGLNYFHLLGGQIYSYEEVVAWLTAAGCASIKRIDLRQTPGVTIVSAIKQ